MKCLVDAGELVKVTGANLRDCARLGLLAAAADGRAKFPIDVYQHLGNAYRFVYRFVESDPTTGGKPNAPLNGGSEAGAR